MFYRKQASYQRVSLSYSTKYFDIPFYYPKYQLRPPLKLHCVWQSLFEWVSCRKIRSAFCFRHHVKIVRLLRKLFMPLTFSETNLHVSNTPSRWNQRKKGGDEEANQKKQLSKKRRMKLVNYRATCEPLGWIPNLYLILVNQRNVTLFD